MTKRPLWGLVSIAVFVAAGCSNGGSSAGSAPAPTSGFAFAADPCQVVTTAMMAALQHDHALQVMLPVDGVGPSQPAQIVQVAGKTYVQFQGVWRPGPQTVAQQIQTVADQAKTAQITCKASGTDAIDGQPVAIYDEHLVNQGTAGDNRLWISTASGLPLRIVTHLDTGAVATQDFRYDNVTAPANVQAPPQ
jgi:uncharacterized Zn-binding protein involved in type VI secretion